MTTIRRSHKSEAIVLNRQPWIVYSLLFCLCFLCESAHGAIIVIDSAFNPSTGNSYLLLSQSNWTDAEAKAVELGSHLVTIDSQAENDWIWDRFGNLGARHLWIGLTDQASEGNFVWTSGAPVAYTNWAPGEPNNVTVEDWAEMQPKALQPTLSDWNDHRNQLTSGPFDEATLHGVVEVEGNIFGVPEPSTFVLFAVGLAGFGLVAWRRRRPE